MTNYCDQLLIFDQVIEKKYQDTIEKYTENISWNFSTGTILDPSLNEGVIEKGKNPFQFIFGISASSLDEHQELKDNIWPLLDFIALFLNSNLQLLRIKFNLLTRSNSKSYHYPHADLDNYTDKLFSALYYVNDSDGPTYFFKQFAPKKNNDLTLFKKVKPKKGRLVLFDSRRFHCSSSPVKNDKRVVLNLVIRLPNDEKNIVF